MFERLRRVPLFADLPEDDLARICADVTPLRLAAGEHLFEEGDAADAAYVVTDGEVEIRMATPGRDAVVAVRGPDEVIGESALLRASKRTAGVWARTDAALLRVPRSGLEALLDSSPEAARTLFGTLVDRMEETAERLRHSERMAQLGTLSAGVAHELNNPAAAVRRSADHLGERLGDLVDVLTGPFEPAAVLPVARALLTAAEDSGPVGDPLAASEAEAALERWLDAREVPDAWRPAAGLAEAGVDLGALEAATDGLAGDDLAAAVRLAVAVVSSRGLVEEVAEGADRLSAIVGALRSFSHLDRAPVGDVDVHRGLDDTLVLLGHRLHGIEVVRDYAADLPRITALGAELNQVWTNLIHNAADALHEAGTPDPVIVVRTRAEEGDVVVEVEDNGPGIPPEAQERIFDAFFTTKAPGAGTGLGLQISYRIVVDEHHGELTVTSAPGRTVGRVVLPVAGPDRVGGR
jgi:signal transduction histidine kinase